MIHQTAAIRGPNMLLLGFEVIIIATPLLVGYFCFLPSLSPTPNPPPARRRYYWFCSSAAPWGLLGEVAYQVTWLLLCGIYWRPLARSDATINWTPLVPYGQSLINFFTRGRHLFTPHWRPLASPLSSPSPGDATYMDFYGEDWLSPDDVKEPVPMPVPNQSS